MLRDPEFTSALVGARMVNELDNFSNALARLGFSPDELDGAEGHGIDSRIDLSECSSAEAASA